MYPIIVVLLLSWSPAVNLGIPGVNDRFPQSVRWQAEHTCLVWQSEIDGDWEIFSRFLIPNLPLYSDTFRITNNATGDMSPVVAYDESRHCFWCAWIGVGSNSNEIFICQSDSLNGWLAPGQVTDDFIYDAQPSVCVIRDTVWVAWSRQNTSVQNIFVSFYNGVSWSAPYAITNDSTTANAHPKINGHYNHPMIVWERSNDIYYCERMAGIWQGILPVTTDPGSDLRPEIAVHHFPQYGGFEGAWIFWYSDRDGNYEVYMTPMDTFNINRRVTINPAFDYEPSPLDFEALIGRENPSAVAFTTSRNGSYDIYSLFGYSFIWDTVAVDTYPSIDQMPCMSGGDWRVWVFWQTDRNGDDDICGSYEWVGGIEEGSGRMADGGGSILRAYPNPFTSQTDIRYMIHDAGYGINDIQIFNATGRLVRSFDHESCILNRESSVMWDGTDDFGKSLAPGVYFCSLLQGDRTVASKLIKIK
jgi:hypothetical protein